MYRLTFLVLIALLIAACSEPPSSEPTTLNYSPSTVDRAIAFAPGTISTETNSEFDIMFSPDGKKAYFSRRAPGGKQKIYQTTFMNNAWTAPSLCPFSSDRDEAASITPNGKLFFFGSERPIPGRPNKGGFDMNVWMMKKKENGWSTPEALPAPINAVQ
ncbi:MAG: hypothetical protein AAF985_23245, partial [Bacteroidota bacterium]